MTTEVSPRADELAVSGQPHLVRRRPAVAGVLSFVVAGAGQLYNGRMLLGFGLLGATETVLLLRGFLMREPWMYLLVLGAFLIVQLAATVEAAVWAARRKLTPRRLVNRGWVLALLVTLVLTTRMLAPEGPLRPADLPTDAMAPTIRMGERVTIDYAYYRQHAPRRGDLVVFSGPGDGSRQLKRVIGLPGERIEMRDGRAIIDGDADLDPWAYVDGKPIGLGGSAQVPAGAVYVLGDNRNWSRDSRMYGSVSNEHILGRAESILLSTDFDRIGLELHD